MTDKRMTDEQLGYPWDAFPERASDFAVCIREHKKAIKRISGLESENEELKRLSPSAELLERISELEGMVAEQQELNDRRLIDVRLKDKRIRELEAKLDRVQCAADELAGALADD